MICRPCLGFEQVAETPSVVLQFDSLLNLVRLGWPLDSWRRSLHVLTAMAMNRVTRQTLDCVGVRWCRGCYQKSTGASCTFKCGWGTSILLSLVWLGLVQFTVKLLPSPFPCSPHLVLTLPDLTHLSHELYLTSISPSERQHSPGFAWFFGAFGIGAFLQWVAKPFSFHSLFLGIEKGESSRVCRANSAFKASQLLLSLLGITGHFRFGFQRPFSSWRFSLVTMWLERKTWTGGWISSAFIKPGKGWRNKVWLHFQCLETHWEVWLGWFVDCFVFFLWCFPWILT